MSAPTARIATSAMQRMARSRLPAASAALSTSASSHQPAQQPIEGKRPSPSAPVPQSALERVAGARLGSTTAFPSKDALSSEGASKNSSTRSPLEAIAQARETSRMGCKPVRDNEHDSIRHKMRDYLLNNDDAPGRGNTKMADVQVPPPDDLHHPATYNP